MARARLRGIKQPHPLGSLPSRSGISLLTAESGITTSTGVKISALPVASSVNGIDQLETNQAGTSRRITLDQVASLVGTELTDDYLPLAGGTLTGALVGTTAAFSAAPAYPNNTTSVATTAYVTAALAKATGDFSAVNTATISLTASLATMKPETILSGNSGSWYSTSTGRYTPPAGRYAINVSCSAQSATAQGLLTNLLRNGAVIATSTNSSPNTSWSAGNTLIVTVDANGTDYYEMQSQMTGGTVPAAGVTFTCFPIFRQ